jgi:hypothetical protein
MVFTHHAQSTPLIAACARCLADAVQGKAATTPDEWREVEKKLTDSVYTNPTYNECVEMRFTEPKPTPARRCSST